MGNNSGSIDGSAVEGENEPKVNTKDMSVEAVLEGNIPYKQRKIFLREMLQCLNKTDAKSNKRLLSTLTKLRCLLGLETNDELGRPNEYFILDESGVEQTQELTRLVRNKPQGWKGDAHATCNRLLNHCGPPLNLIPRDMPDGTVHGLLKLSLAGTDLSRRNRIKTVNTIILNNRELKNVELAFTNLNNAGLQSLFPALAALRGLSYLGLRGNNLRNNLLDRFVEILKSAENFPSLMWVDFINNVDIFILPDDFLETIRSRWPQVGYKPSFRDLVEGKAVVSEDLLDINV